MTKQKLLVVDDNTNNIKLLTGILEDVGYSVFVVNNGLHVMETARSLEPDAILLDIMLPGLNGFEICEQLKQDTVLHDIPVIMVTAKTNGNDVRSAFEKGAFDYIKKPIDEDEVVARVKSAIKYKKQQDELREMAMRDSLTMLYNNAMLKEILHKEIKRQTRKEGSLSFAMLDIDYFKSINDNYGHVWGDFILKELAEILNNTVRAGDFVGRYGGEEFGLIMTELGMKDVLSLCERLRSKIERHVFSFDTRSIHITVSIGISYHVHLKGASALDIIKKADEALYRAKNSGRNRVELISDERN